MEADGVPSIPPCHCQCSVLRVFKAIATQIRGKSKQTLKSLKIEPGTAPSESCALANRATTAYSAYCTGYNLGLNKFIHTFFGTIWCKHIIFGSKLGPVYPNNNCFGAYSVIIGSKLGFTCRIDYTT